MGRHRLTARAQRTGYSTPRTMMRAITAHAAQAAAAACLPPVPGCTGAA
jgi:hypothetical protein